MTQLNENGMYSNTRPKRGKAHGSSAKPTNTPDDVFVGASDDRPGFIAIALKGRTAFVKPSVAKELAKQLELLASSAEQKDRLARIDKIRDKASRDALEGQYKNPYAVSSDGYAIYDDAWHDAKMSY